MRARQRHFNPRDAGALTGYDARFISGIANSAAISTWTSRTGSNDATQSNSTFQPTYQESQLNGNPVVRFDGVNDRMIHNTPNVTNATILVIGKSANNSNDQRFVGTGGISGGRAYAFIGSRNNVVAFASYNFFSTTLNSNEFSIIKWVVNGTSIEISKNRISESGTFSVYTASADYRLLGAGQIRSAPGTFLNGDIAQCLIFNTAQHNSISKRVEHAAAFSFKIACN